MFKYINIEIINSFCVFIIKKTLQYNNKVAQLKKTGIFFKTSILIDRGFITPYPICLKIAPSERKFNFLQSLHLHKKG